MIRWSALVAICACASGCGSDAGTGSQDPVGAGGSGSGSTGATGGTGNDAGVGGATGGNGGTGSIAGTGGSGGNVGGANNFGGTGGRYPFHYEQPIPITCTGSAREVDLGYMTPDFGLDVVVLDTLGNSVCIAAGNGDGTFAPSIPFTVGAAPTSLAIGDFDGDAIADVATVHPSLGEVHVSRGTGTGQLAPPLVFPVGKNPLRVRAALLDSDARADLVVAVEGDDAIAVLRGDATTTLAAPTFIATSDHPKDIALGDVTADGDVDVVIQHDQTLERTLLIGLGDGSFSPPDTLVIGDDDDPVESFSTAIGDVTQDGYGDIATAHAGNKGFGVVSVSTSGPNSEVYANFITGDGVVPSEPREILLEDMFFDSSIELICADLTAKKIDMMGLKPDGSWSGGDELPAPGGPRGLAIGDFNGDGVKDIAAALDVGGANVWLGKEP